jgi:hypothetical protein
MLLDINVEALSTAPFSPHACSVRRTRDTDEYKDDGKSIPAWASLAEGRGWDVAWRGADRR